MRTDQLSSPCKTTTQLPFTIIHHAGTASHEHIPSSHQKPSILRGKSSSGGPAPSNIQTDGICYNTLFMDTVLRVVEAKRWLWRRTKYGQGYVKIHNGTTTYWQKKSRDGLALSEGTTQHEGYRGNILNRGELKQDLRGPHHPFFFASTALRSAIMKLSASQDAQSLERRSSSGG